MNIETLKIDVADLTLGMLVVKLDRPWLETPFKLQGFKIQKAAELRQLAKYCKHVYIDVERGVLPPGGKGVRVTLSEDGEHVADGGFIAAAKAVPSAARARLVDQYALPPPAATYARTTDFATELPRAVAAVGAAKTAMRALMDALRAGRPGELTAVKDAVAELEESILRQPDAALLVRALAADQPFSLRHCVHSTILAIAIGRELGLKRQAIHELGIGMLLADIGKLRLPMELLRANRRLTRHETEIIKLHVKYGVEMAGKLGGLTPGTLVIVASHHERFNGSGYPEGLRGGEISLGARVAGLADTFDAVTSERAYSTPIATHEVLQELYAAPVDLFQRELVAVLIQALGTHPIGSLVRLSDASVALVVAINPQRRLLPKVMRLTDPALRPLAVPEPLDLASAEPALTVTEVFDPAAAGVAYPTSDLIGIAR